MITYINTNHKKETFFLKKFIGFLIVFFIASFAYSQEICNNGIDDDANGLIDLNDPACHCTTATTTTTVPSLIPNPSFENTACCPSTYSQLNCAQGWVQASSATSDYMNTCGFVFTAATAAGIFPLPAGNGNGAVGFITSSGYQEYVGSCLSSPMLAGTPYTITMGVASAPIDGSGGVCDGGSIFYGPIDMVIYGATSCSSMPFSGYLCPPAPWVVLGTANYNPNATWGTVTISFTPAANINAIIIGSPCTLPASYATSADGCYPYFYVDNLILNETSAFTPTSLSQTGTWCNNNIQLTTPGIAGGAYQWYLNGVALPGQTGLTLNVSTGSLPAGHYELVTTTGAWSTCQEDTTSVIATPPVLPTITQAGPFCANAPPTTLAASITGGTWSGNGITNASTGAFDPSLATVGNNVITYVTTGVCGGSATSTIVINPLPTINTSVTTNTATAAVAANSTTICIGQQTATLTAGGASSYTWNPAATLNTAFGPTVHGSPAVTTDYTVTGTDANGCVNMGTFTINVAPLFPLTVTNSTICVGQAGTLTAGGAATYTWTPGVLPINGTIVTGSPLVTTQYTVAGTSASGCIGAGTSTITVNPLPLPTATSNTPCISQQDLLLNCPLNGMSSYSWTGPNSFISPVQNPTIAYTNVVATTAGAYILSVTDNNTCSNTFTLNVVLNPLPIVTVNSLTVCEHQPIDLTSSGGVSYSWLGPLAYASANQNPNVTTDAATNMSGSYVVTVTDANNCKNTNAAQVLVNPLPTISVNTSTICSGQQTATLTATGASTYVWSPATGLVSITGAVTFGAPSSNTDYTVTGTDINNCVNTATTSVYVNQLPVVSTTSVVPGCVPLCSTIIVSSTPAASSYSCSFSNGESVNQTSLNPPVSSFPTTTCFTKAGSFPIKVTVTDINSCINTATTIAMAYPIPIADFSYEPNPVSILYPDANFINQSVGQITTYAWNFGDTSTSSIISPAHTYADTGTYYVSLVVVSAQGCVDTTIKPLIVQNDYVLYIPNAFTPNGDGKNDTFAAVANGVKNFKLSIFDRWGNSLFYTENINVGWNGTMQNKGNEILQQDVYVWKIDAIDASNKSKSLHGTVTLLK